jgi:hypothetical protein
MVTVGLKFSRVYQEFTTPHSAALIVSSSGS